MRSSSFPITGDHPSVSLTVHTFPSWINRSAEPTMQPFNDYSSSIVKRLPPLCCLASGVLRSKTLITQTMAWITIGLIYFHARVPAIPELMCRHPTRFGHSWILSHHVKLPLPFMIWAIQLEVWTESPLQNWWNGIIHLSLPILRQNSRVFMVPIRLPGERRLSRGKPPAPYDPQEGSWWGYYFLTWQKPWIPSLMKLFWKWLVPPDYPLPTADLLFETPLSAFFCPIGLGNC